MELKFLLDIAIILVLTKILGLLTKKIKLPQVVGALIAGLLLGPSLFNLVSKTDIISEFAEIGVIILMFTAGLETNVEELKAVWKKSLLIASFGIILPLAGGLLLAKSFGDGVLESIFMGVILTATSVSITVETLQEMGKLKTSAGTAILGAAVIDDIIGIIILSVVIGMKGQVSFSFAQMGIIFLKIIVFFVFAAFCGYLVFRFFRFIYKKKGKVHRLSIFALAFCFFLSFMAEKFGLADITGAYFAGLILCSHHFAEYIEEKIEILAYVLFSPIFFASIGLGISFQGFTGQVAIFAILLLIIAVGTKVIGCGGGALLCKYKPKEALQIGVGMVSRGEVALIVAGKGMVVGLMNPDFFPAVILVVIVTTLVTPILLKIVFHQKDRQRDGEKTI